MDFSTNDVIISSPVKSFSSPSKGESVRKHCTVPIQLLIVDIGDDTFLPVGVKVLNSFQIKNLLEYTSRYPCNSLFMAGSKILYQDKVREAVNSCEFSETILGKHTAEELRKTTWMPSAVITLVADRDAEDVMQAYELIQTLDKKAITNSLGEAAIVHIKIEDHLIIPPAEVHILKTFLLEAIESKTKIRNGENTMSPPRRNLNIVGANPSHKRKRNSLQDSTDFTGSAISNSVAAKKNAKINVLEDDDEVTDSPFSSTFCPPPSYKFEDNCFNFNLF